MAGRDPYGGTGGGPGLQGGTGPTSGLTSRGGTLQQQRASRRDQLGRPEQPLTTDRSPSRPTASTTNYTSFTGPAPGPGGTRGGRRATSTGRIQRSAYDSPSGGGAFGPSYGDDPGYSRNVPQSISTSAFTVGDPLMDRGGLGDPRMDRGMDRGMDPHRSTSMPPGPMHGRSRSASRGLPPNRTGPGYHSLDRDGYGADRDFMPIREPRERSLDRDFMPGSYGGPYGRRDRSLDRGGPRDPMLDPDDPGMFPRDPGYGLRDPMMRDPGMGGMRPRLSPNPMSLGPRHGEPPFFGDLQQSHAELQRDLANLKKELELTNQKLGSSMHSIKTFWSPELKKERALRKEEAAKYSLINDQLKLLNSENQVSGRALIIDKDN